MANNRHIPVDYSLSIENWSLFTSHENTHLSFQFIESRNFADDGLVSVV